MRGGFGKASNEALLRLMLVCTCNISAILQSSKSFKLLSVTKNCWLSLILHVSILCENVTYSHSHLQFSYNVCLVLSLSLGFLKQAFSFRRSSDTETSNFLLLAWVSWWDPDFFILLLIRDKPTYRRWSAPCCSKLDNAATLTFTSRQWPRIKYHKKPWYQRELSLCFCLWQNKSLFA